MEGNVSLHMIIIKKFISVQLLQSREESYRETLRDRREDFFIREKKKWKERNEITETLYWRERTFLI